MRCVDVHHELRRPMKHAVGPAIRSCAPRDCAGDLSPPPPPAQSSDRCAIGPAKPRRGFQSRWDLPQIVRPSRLPTGLGQKHGGQPSRLLPSVRHPPDSRPQCQRPQGASAQVAAKRTNRPTNVTSARSGDRAVFWRTGLPPWRAAPASAVATLRRRGAEVIAAHDLSPRLAQDGTQQHDALCAGAGVVTRHRRSSHRPQVYLTVVQDAGARRGRGPVQ